MKIPKNYIPGTNPYKSLPKKPIMEYKKTRKNKCRNHGFTRKNTRNYT